MWGRLKRRILRSKAGGVYHASHDDDFSDARDTYRDFREELYDESRETANWKEGGKSGKRMSLTKTAFPNLDRCSCGSPGGRDQENVAKSETLRRKNDFILEGEGKSWNPTKGRFIGKARNEYTSTSTGPGSRGRPLDGGEQRLRASTSTGQLPCSPQSEEQAKNERNSQQRNGRSFEAPEQRMAYSDDEDDDDDEEESEEEVEEEAEEEDSADGEDAHVPSTSQPFRNSSQSDGTKSSSNSSDYTSLAFDLNYVKVSPPKLRRRRKKNAEKDSAPLMVRRERRFPEPSPPDHLPPKGAESKRPIVGTGNLDERETSGVARLDGVDAGLPRGTSKDVVVHTSIVQLKSDTSYRQPAALPLPHTSTEQQSSGYIAWADVHNPPPVNSKEGSRDICEALGSARIVDDEVEDEKVTGRGCEISTSGSVLQFTFTVRLDNDVIRGTRRDADRSNGAGGLSSLVSGRVDILNQEKPVAASVPRRTDISNQDQQQQQTSVPGSECLSLVQRSFKVQLKDRGADVDTSNATSSQEARLTESSNVSTDRSDSFKDPTSSESQRQVVQSSEGYGLDRSPTTRGGLLEDRSVALGAGWRQQSLEDLLSSQRTTMDTVAIVHKSASDLDGEEMDVALSRNELGPTDGRADYFQAGGDPVSTKVKPDPSKAFDEVDSCIESHSARGPHQCQPSPAPLSSAEDGAELTHMSWDEVMKEAQSLGIPLNRPLQQSGSCDKARPLASTDQQVLCSSSYPPSKQSSSFQDAYWVCSSCTEAMHSQSSSPIARKTPSKTSSPFKEKFKLQSIFGGSGSKKPKDERTCKGQSMSSPLSRKLQSPCAKYKTMPTPRTATTKDIVLCPRQKCTCTSRCLQTNRERSLSPGSSSRCVHVVQVSPSSKARGFWGRGADTRGQRISHLCSPPLLRCRFSLSDRTIQSTSTAASSAAKKSAHLSSEMLTSSSSPVIRRANDNDRDFLKSLAQLMGCSWYWGSLNFEAAEAELSDRPDGAFLVRDSSDDRYILSVSFRSQRSTHHVRIERHNGLFSFSAEHGLHESPDIVDFIEKAMELSQSGQCLYYLRPRQPNSAPVPVQLLYPISRFAH